MEAPMTDALKVLEYVLTWLGEYPLIPLTYFALLTISFNWFFGGLGLGDLFWSQDRRKQFFIGLNTAFLVAEILVVRYLLPSARPTLWLERQLAALPSLFPWLSPSVPADAPLYQLGQYLLALFPLGLLLLALPAVGGLRLRFALPLGLLAGFAVTVLVVWATDQSGLLDDIPKTPGVEKVVPAQPPVSPALEAQAVVGDPKPRALSLVFVLLLAANLLLVGLLYLLHFQAPVLVLLCLLGLFHAGYGYVAYRWSGFQHLVLLGLLLWGFLANRVPHKVRLPGLEDDYSHPRPLTDTRAAPAPPGPALHRGPALLARAAANWGAVRTPQAPPLPKLVVVAASGGGIRAAVWACAVLEQLEALQPRAFPAQLRLISGASGGMVGAAYYVAQRALAPDQFAAGIDPTRPCPLARAMARDSLRPVVSTMLFNDLPSIWWPFPRWPFLGYRDRGRSLELAWAHNTAATAGQVDSPLDRPLRDLSQAEADCRVPVLIFSPMLVEDARRLLISNLDLTDLCATYPTHAPGNVFSVSAVEFFKLLPHARASFKLGTAARMNASFPIVSPAVFLPTNPLRRVVDAGYYDNYGIDLAAEWLYRHLDAVRQHTSGVLILEVRAYPSAAERTQFLREDGPDLLGALRWLTSPVSGVLSMRERSPWYRNDERLQTLADLLAPGFFRTASLEYAGDAPLNWSLTDGQGADILAQAQDRVKALLDDPGLRAWFPLS
jgi:hypothetical protein